MDGFGLWMDNSKKTVRHLQDTPTPPTPVLFVPSKDQLWSFHLQLKDLPFFHTRFKAPLQVATETRRQGLDFPPEFES